MAKTTNTTGHGELPDSAGIVVFPVGRGGDEGGCGSWRGVGVGGVGRGAGC